MIKDYQSAIKLLTSQGKFKINLGLDRMSSLMELYGNPQESFDCIQVAGTNGKGSVCSVLAEILKTAGFKVGLYTSPHIFEYTERIKINGAEIAEDIFAELVFDVIEKAEANGLDLTEFEIITAVMFIYFMQENIDIAVLETGLGGRLDATNIVKSNICSVITHIDLDHTERLGDTKEKIAFEKAGIIKPERPVITAEKYEAIQNVASEKHSQVIEPIEFGENYELSLKGCYQKENLALALTCIKNMFGDIPDNVIKKALKNVEHPFRFQYFKDKNLIIDGAHNPNGAEGLRKSLDEYFPDEPRRFVFGCLRNKDYEKMMTALFRPQDEVLFCEFNYPNSTSFEELSAKCPVCAQKFESAKTLTPDKLNIICGSFYMIKHLHSQVLGQHR